MVDLMKESSLDPVGWTENHGKADTTMEACLRTTKGEGNWFFPKVIMKKKKFPQSYNSVT